MWLLLTLLWAICSTVLIRPWFWKSIIKRRTLEGDEENTGFKNVDDDCDPKLAMIMQCFFFFITCIFSLFVYLRCKVRYNFYGSIVPILVVLFFQIVTTKWMCLDKHYKAKMGILIIVGVICFGVCLEDYTREAKGIEKFNEEVPIVFFSDETKKEENLPSTDIIKGLFKATEVLNPVYSNGKFIYTITDCPNGYGIVVINESSADNAKFVKCSIEFRLSTKLRRQYPYDRIAECNIVITDNDVPFGMYAIMDKTRLFGELVLDKYVLQNMITGEITEYTAETLPEFAR